MGQRLLVLGVAVFCASTHPASADQLTPQKRSDINHLLDLTGAMALGKQVMDFMVDQVTQGMRKSRPDIPQKMIDVTRAEVSAVLAEHLPDLTNELVDRYAAHFTHAEIKELIRFYETEIGKKSIRVMPVLMQELLVSGQRWGESLQPIIRERLVRRFKQEGFDPGK